MHIGLLIFGIIVFIIGLFCIFYKEQLTPEIDWGGGLVTPATWDYPYMHVGIILSTAGIVLTTLGFILGFIPPRKK